MPGQRFIVLSCHDGTPAGAAPDFPSRMVQAQNAADPDVPCHTERVSWKPGRSTMVVPDHRLDPYRDLGAVVRFGDHEIMQIYVQVDAVSRQTSGHLWWRQWSRPREFVILHMLMEDGFQTDSWLMEDQLDDELRSWAEGRFDWLGQQHTLTWFDTQRSAALRETLRLDAT
ncbi:hypothetical protein GCM10028820_26940 [Tessaracoccus terricola]